MGIAGVLLLVWLGADIPLTELRQARDAQDRATLQRAAAILGAQAAKETGNAEAQYRAAFAESTLAEVAQEMRDKAQARVAAETGMQAAERAIALQPQRAEYHRIHATLCGQAAAAVGGLGALKYGRCALTEVEQAIKLDPKASMNYLSRGVGNFYLPAALGGGVDVAIPDFEKAAALDPNSADAYLWLGVALRKANRSAEARKAFQHSVALNPARVWARQQLEKTPAQ